MTKHPSTTHFASYDNFPSAPHRVCLPPFANTNPSSHVGVHVCPIGKSEEQLPTPPFFGAREASQSDCGGHGGGDGGDGGGDGEGDGGGEGGGEGGGDGLGGGLGGGEGGGGKEVVKGSFL